MTQYSFDVSVFFLCVIRRSDDDLIHCVKAPLSKLVLYKRKNYSKHKWCENNEGLCCLSTSVQWSALHLYRHIHDVCSLTQKEVWRQMHHHTYKHTLVTPGHSSVLRAFETGMTYTVPERLKRSAPELLLADSSYYCFHVLSVIFLTSLCTKASDCSSYCKKRGNIR